MNNCEILLASMQPNRAPSNNKQRPETHCHGSSIVEWSFHRVDLALPHAHSRTCGHHESAAAALSHLGHNASTAAPFQRWTTCRLFDQSKTPQTFHVSAIIQKHHEMRTAWSTNAKSRQLTPCFFDGARRLGADAIACQRQAPGGLYAYANHHVQKAYLMV